jgi:Uncharacterized protein conserved in bacteria
MEEIEEIYTKEQLDAILKKLEEQTKKEAFRIVINKKRKPELYDSKFGGVPYWDKKLEYPTDSDGNKMILLAQINLNELESDELPQTGMLQFFIANDEMYGCDFDEPDKQNGFRVIYHETIDKNITREDVLEFGILSNEDMEEDSYGSPVDGEFAVDIKKTKISISTEDYQFSKLFSKIAKELNFSVEDEYDMYDILDEDLYEELSEKNSGHWLFGYPYFTQGDPREFGEKLQYYDTLLFQMDSEWVEEASDYEILWGDVGVANFFINKEDLKKKDFRRVMYTWDCC